MKRSKSKRTRGRSRDEEDRPERSRGKQSARGRGRDEEEPRRRKKKRGKKGGGRAGFKYRHRSKEEYEDRTKNDSKFDRFLPGDLPYYKAKDDNCIRPLPPTWEDATHYGLELEIHRNVGADNQTYVCPKMWDKSPCPVCEYVAQEKRTGAADDKQRAAELKELRLSKVVVMWVIDRDEEDKGPLLYSMPWWSLDREFGKLAYDKRTGAVLEIDHPDEGYDLEFTREKLGSAVQNVKYGGAQIARRESPLCEDEDQQDEWLDYVQDKPITELVVTYSYDHIAEVFGGVSAVDEDEEDEGEDDSRRSSRTRGRSRRRRDEEDDDEEDDDEEEEDDEDEEEEEERPRRKKKSRKRRSVSRHDDEEEDDDEEEEDEDDEEEEDEDEDRPRRGRRSSKPSSRGKASRRRQLKDDDEDDDDRDSRTARRGRKRSRRRSR